MPNAPDLTTPAGRRAALARLDLSRPLALAVSGGSDSVALLHLYADLAPPDARAASLVLTVDHQLRAASAAEAEDVGRRCAGLGLRHRILRWDGPKPAANLADAARRARYGLMLAALREAGLDRLVTAHTRDDQAETLLMALGRGSGVHGLAAMPAERMLGEARLLRPLLDVSRAALRTYLHSIGQGWIEDPGNDDPRRLRARVRRILPDLAELGLTAERLAATAARLSRAATALDVGIAALARRAVTTDPAGFAGVDLPALLDAADDIALRLLSRLIMAVGGRTYPPRLGHVERLWDAVRQRPTIAGGLSMTLAGTLAVAEGGAQRLWLAPEPGRTGFGSLTLAAGECGVWADRHAVAVDAAAGFVTIAAAGPSQLRALAPEHVDVPAAILATVPAIHTADGRIGTPLSGFACPPPWRALVRLTPLRLTGVGPLTLLQQD